MWSHDDERHRHVLRLRQLAALERRKEEVDADTAEIVGLLRHSRKTGVGDPRERDVVEPDDADIGGYVDAGRTELVHQ